MPTTDPTAELIKRFCMLVIEPVLWATVEVLGPGTTGSTVAEVRERLQDQTTCRTIAFTAHRKFVELVPDSAMTITSVVVHVIYEAIHDILGGGVNMTGVTNCLKSRSHTHFSRDIAARAAVIYASYHETHPAPPRSTF